MSFDTIAFGTVNSIHYRSSLHSRRDVLYVAFFVSVHWIYNGHAKSTWNKWANGRTHWRAWPTSLSCNCFEFRHTLTFRQTAHCRTQEEAVCHFFKQKNQAQQCVSNNSIRCAVPAMACGSWSKKQFMRLQQHSNQLKNKHSKHSCIDFVFAICHSEVPFFQCLST